MLREYSVKGYSAVGSVPSMAHGVIYFSKMVQSTESLSATMSVQKLGSKGANTSLVRVGLRQLN